MPSLSSPSSRQDGLEPALEHRVEPTRRILGTSRLRQRDRPFGEALENQIVERPVRGEFHRRLDPVGGKPGTAANPHGLHRGNTPSRTQAIVMTTDAAKR
jgi:hypothetical protein